MVLVLRLVSPTLATAFVEFCRALYCLGNGWLRSREKSMHVATAGRVLASKNRHMHGVIELVVAVVAGSE